MSGPGPGTRVVRAGLPQPEQGEPFLPGPVFAAPFHLSGDPESSPYGYTREGNPTFALFEAAVGELEGGQALLFREAVDVTGIVLTKLDGTAKGGIALAIAQELGVPVKLIGIGEALEDLRPFDPDDFAQAILEP